MNTRSGQYGARRGHDVMASSKVVVGGLLLAALVTIVGPGVTNSMPAADAAPLIHGPGCAPRLSAVVYTGGGHRVERARSHAPVGCMTRVGASNETAMVGVTRSGSVFFAPILGPVLEGTDGWSTPCPTDELLARSTNQGGTWTLIHPGVPRTSGCAPAFMTVDPTTSRIWFPTTLGAPNPACGTHLVFSDDDGKRWTTGGDTPCPGQGGQKLFEGIAPASGPDPKGYPHVVYYCANLSDLLHDQVLECYKSLDGGLSFTPVFSDPNGGIGHPDPPLPTGCTTQSARAGVVAAHGVLVFPTIECGVLGVAVSRDEGTTWQFHSGVAAGVEDLMPTSSAVDSDGDVYISYRGTGGLPYLVVSTDDGSTWTVPLKVAPPGVTRVQGVAVAARKHGQVALAYLGTTNGTDFNGYITESNTVLDKKPVFWSAPVNRPSEPLATTKSPDSYQDRFFYLSVAIPPDGTPWAGFQCADTVACPKERVGIVGRLMNR